MEDRCPTCERDLLQLEDYPLIYVASFVRNHIPTDFIFPFHDQEIFNPDSESIDRRPPKEVLEFFRDNEEAVEFDYDGWIWTKRHLNQEWDMSDYLRAQDRRDIIIAKLNPYLDSLEGMIGKEVPRAELLPQFPREDYPDCSFKIPDTNHYLMFDEQEKISAGLKVAKLCLIRRGWRGDLTLVVSGECLEQEVGRLEYEGRLR